MLRQGRPGCKFIMAAFMTYFHIHVRYKVSPVDCRNFADVRRKDGKAVLVQAASVSIHGPHGQHIENIHLRPYSSEEQFWDELSSEPYAKLIDKAAEFLDNSGGQGDDVMVFIRSAVSNVYSVML